MLLSCHSLNWKPLSLSEGFNRSGGQDLWLDHADPVTGRGGIMVESQIFNIWLRATARSCRQFQFYKVICKKNKCKIKIYKIETNFLIPTLYKTPPIVVWSTWKICFKICLAYLSNICIQSIWFFLSYDNGVQNFVHNFWNFQKLNFKECLNFEHVNTFITRPS